MALWSVSGAERAAGGARLSEVYLGDSGGCSGCFEIPRSTRESRQQRPRASRFRGSVPAGGRVWNLARRSADRDAKIEPAARKMTAVRRSHLMHPMNQGFILSDSQKESVLKRRAFETRKKTMKIKFLARIFEKLGKKNAPRTKSAVHSKCSKNLKKD